MFVLRWEKMNERLRALNSELDKLSVHHMGPGFGSRIDSGVGQEVLEGTLHCLFVLFAAVVEELA